MRRWLVWERGGSLGRVKRSSVVGLPWCGIVACHYEQRKDQSEEMLFSCMGQYHAGAIFLERTSTLPLCFVSLSYATKAFFFSPRTAATLDVALQIQSVALESHHACLVFTRSAHRA